MKFDEMIKFISQTSSVIRQGVLRIQDGMMINRKSAC